MLVLSGAEKAAALLLVMGKESAIQLTDFLSKDDLSLIVEAAQDLPALSFDTVNQLVMEFENSIATYGMISGSDGLSKLLRKPKSSGSNQDPAGGNDMQKKNEDSELDLNIINLFLQTEKPKVSSLLIGALSDEMAARALSELQPELRNDIFQHYINRRKVDERLLGLLEIDIVELIANTKPDEGNTMLVERAANLINQFSADVSDDLVEFLEGTSPENAAAIKKSLFKFTSIELLSKESRSLLFDSIQTDEVVKILAGISDSLKKSILDILSQRNRRLVESELARAITQPDETEKVQKAVVARALNLAKQGVISLPEVE